MRVKGRERYRNIILTETAKEKKARLERIYAERRKRLYHETEEEREKRLAVRRAHYAAHGRERAFKLSEKELAEKKARRREYLLNKELAESEEQRRARLNGLKEKYQSSLAKKTPEEREAFFELKREKQRFYKANETPEEKQARIQQSNERNRQRRLNETAEQREKRLEEKRKYYQKHKKKVAEQHKLRMAKETPEQRAKRLERELNSYYRSRMQMSETERQAKLKRKRELRAKEAMMETELKRKERLEKMRQYGMKRRRMKRQNQKNESVGELLSECNTSQSTGDHSSVQMRSDECIPSTGTGETSERVAKRPPRSSKSSAKAKIHEQVESDGSFDEEIRNNSSVIGSKAEKVDKLSLKAVVMLERISLDECNRRVIVAEKPCKGRTKIWHLPRLEVRLERIDIIKALKELKVKSESSTNSMCQEVGGPRNG